MLGAVVPAAAETAAERLRPVAEAGDPQAALALAIAYDLGRGAAADAAQACVWYRRAAEAGLAAAEFNMGVMQDSGRCGTKDPAQSALWYGRAAARGHARAQYDLALLYAAGEGVPQNPAVARAWSAAAMAGGAPAGLPVRAAPAPATTVVEAKPLWPSGTVAEPEAAAGIPLVWTSGSQPDGTEFLVQVYDTARAAEVHADDTPRTASLARLPPGDYAWRVLTANASTRHYATSAWTAFTLIAR